MLGPTFRSLSRQWLIIPFEISVFIWFVNLNNFRMFISLVFPHHSCLASLLRGCFLTDISATFYQRCSTMECIWIQKRWRDNLEEILHNCEFYCFYWFRFFSKEKWKMNIEVSLCRLSIQAMLYTLTQKNSTENEMLDKKDTVAYKLVFWKDIFTRAQSSVSPKT